MFELIRTNSEDKDFLQLVKNLDAELLSINGEDHIFYGPMNKLDAMKNVVVAYENSCPLACGAMRQYGDGVMEIKRMYTSPSARGKRMASLVLAELEKWALELCNRKCILETGRRLPSAITLYMREGYKIIANYGPYVGDEQSVCFGKDL